MAGLLTARQAAELLNLSQKYVCDLSRQKRLPAIKMLNRWRFSRAELNRWLEEQRNKEEEP